MVMLEVDFPAGRYHATTSGQHVNEGMVEWPPSPWRVVRALIATGYTTQQWTEVPEVARGLFAKLADTPPSYQLPPASLAHSRHYMPLGVLDKGREKTTLVLDTWADVSDGTMAIEWQVQLDANETELLARLCDAMGYLGRSESWVKITLRSAAAPIVNTQRAYPCEGAKHPGRGWEQISLMVPEPCDAFTSWRERAVEQVLAPLPLPENKKPSKKLLATRAKAQSAIPESLLDAMQWDTARWKAHRWGQPPGSRRILYWRRSNALETTPPVRNKRPALDDRVECTLLAIATATGNNSPLPSVARTLPQAELLHCALLSRLGDEAKFCPELTGRCEDDGTPAKGHQHAYILPLDLDGDGHIDHYVIHARLGLGHQASQALRSVRKTWQKRGQDLQVAVAGSGDLANLRDLPTQLAGGITRLLGPPGGATTWISETPFVPTRFVKPNGSNTLVAQIQRELGYHGHPSANVEVHVLPWRASNLHLRHAVRVRRGCRTKGPGPKGPPMDQGFAIRLRFDQPVTGPISLGYASHFGLGLFQAEDSSGSGTVR